MTICTHEAQPNPFQVGFVVIQLESISKVVSYCLNCWKVRQKMATTARPPHAGNAKEKLPSTEHQAYCQMAEKKSRNNVRVHQITYTHTTNGRTIYRHYHLFIFAAFGSLQVSYVSISRSFSLSLSICVRGVCMCECVHDFKSKNLIEFSDTHKSFECNRLIIFSCG